MCSGSTQRNPAPLGRPPASIPGLPLRDPGKFLFAQVAEVAADPQAGLVLAGGKQGVYRSTDQGVRFEPASRKEFPETVTLPDTWLFTSGEHDIQVVSEDEAS